MGKLVLFCLLLLAEFNKAYLSPKQANFLFVAWIFLIGWVMVGGGKKEKTKARRKYFYEDDEE